jgi:MFS family permease
MAMGLAPLGLTFLVVERTGSYAVAGALGAASTLSGAVVGRYTSRLVDRHGQSTMIPWLLTGHLLFSLALIISVEASTAVALWLVLAGLSGALMVNLGAMTRTRWAGMVEDGPSLSSAYSLEAMADEMAFMLGPPLATMLAIWIAPIVPVLAAMALTTAGALLLAMQRRTQPPPSAKGVDQGAGTRFFAMPGLPVLFVLMLLMGIVFGTNGLTTVAFAASIGRPELAGFLMAVFPAAALLGGAILTVLPRRWSLTTQIRVGLVMQTAALVPLGLVSSPVVFAICAFLIGLSIPAIMVGSFSLVAALVPKGRLTEALSFSGAGITLGMALSSTLAGVIIDAHGPSWAFPVSAISAAIATSWFNVRLRQMRGAEDDAGRRNAPTAPPHDVDSASKAAVAR